MRVRVLLAVTPSPNPPPPPPALDPARAAGGRQQGTGDCPGRGLRLDQRSSRERLLRGQPHGELVINAEKGKCYKKEERKKEDAG